MRGKQQPAVESWRQRRGDGAASTRPSRLRLLTDAARGISAELPRDQLLQRLSDIAREVIGAHQCVISLNTDDGTQAVPGGGGIAAPLLGSDGRSIGLIQLSDKYEGDFTEEDEELVVHLAQLAYLAIEGASVRERAIESAALLQAVESAAPVGFAILDEELRYLRVNEALAEANGISAEEHVGRTIREVVPAIADQVERGVRKVFDGWRPMGPEEISGPSPGVGDETRHWLVTRYPVELPGGRAVGAVVIDITESRLATERLRGSEERYRSLVEITHDLIWTVDADGRFSFLSGAVERMYGYSAKELMGKPFLDFSPVHQRARSVSLFARGSSGEAIEGETQLVHRDGSVRTVEFRSLPVLDEQGNVVGITGASTDVTERRRSEEALRQSEERFRSLFEEAAIGMALMDADGRFLQVNPAFSKLLGRSREALSGLTWDEVVHDEDREMVVARRERPLAGAADARPIEMRYVHADGHTVWARVMTASVQSGAGEPPYTLVQAIDLTKQRKLEEATSRLYALTRDLFCTLGFDGYIKSANPAWERALGYTTEELISRPFISFVDPADRQRTMREFERLRAAGELTLNFENRYLHKDGSQHWLLWSTYVSSDDELIYGVAKDVTDRKRSEERLRESERKYRDLVETSSDLIWSTDTGGCFTFVNRAARRIYGYEPEEMLGRPIGDFESDEQRLKDVEAFKRVLSGTPLFNYGTRHIRKDGHSVDLSVNAIVLHDEQGRVLGATGTATDVTDPKRFEARQAAVAELGRRALEGIGLREITEAAVALVADTLDLDYAAVVELLPGDELLELHATAGWPVEAASAGCPADPQASHAGYAIHVDGPVVVEDFEHEKRFRRSRALAELEVRSGVCVTIEGESRPFGALCAHSKRGRSFSAEEVNFLQALANVLATAIGRKRTEERIVELAAARGRLVAQTLAAEDRARRSISEVLHDHALQDLLASRQDLVEVSEEPDGDPERVVRAREGIERAVQLLREAVFNLHPVVLDHAGLASAVRAVADHQARRGGFECSIEVDDAATGVHDELILSLARELLTNVAKHADAREVTVEVRRSEGWITLVVEDDGQGIAPGRREAALREGHVGLASSVERVEALAGRLDVGARPGGGTRACAVLPARRAAAHRADRPRRLSRLSERRREYGR